MNAFKTTLPKQFTRAHASFGFITRTLIYLTFTDRLSVFYVTEEFQGQR
jgi:hypothetical protein